MADSAARLTGGNYARISCPFSPVDPSPGHYGLLFGGVWDDDPADVLFGFVDALNNDAVV
jgi:hypothetical protein